MSTNKNNLTLCAIVRLQNRGEQVTEASIKRELKNTSKRELLEEIRGMDESEIEAEKQMHALTEVSRVELSVRKVLKNRKAK